MNKEHQVSTNQAKGSLKLSQATVLLAFVISAGTNFYLINILNKAGGIDLVGTWALITATLLTMAFVDLGATNALIREVGTKGLAKSLPHLRFLILVCLLSLALVAPLLAVSVTYGGELQSIFFMLLAAAILQVGSDWIVAIRIGTNQYWLYNVKTILRSLVLLLVVIWLNNFGAVTSFNLTASVLFSRIIEFAAASLLLPKAVFSSRNTSSARDVLSLIAEFSALDLVIKLSEPITRHLINFGLGVGALGVFSVSTRLPITIKQAFGEGLRAMLPNLAQMNDQKRAHDVDKVLTFALKSQLVLVTPFTILLFFSAQDVIVLWLSNEPEYVVICLQLAAIGTLISAWNAPIYWAMQAFGLAYFIAKANVSRLFIFCILAVAGLLNELTIIAFMVIFVTTQLVVEIMTIYKFVNTTKNQCWSFLTVKFWLSALAPSCCLMAALLIVNELHFITSAVERLAIGVVLLALITGKSIINLFFNVAH